MKTKILLLLSAFQLFSFSAFSSGPLPTPFIFYSFDEYGNPNTNAVTLTPWPNTNQIVAVSNYVVGYRARTYNPDTNGYVAGYAMPNVYKLTIADDDINNSLIFGMPLSSSTQNVAMLEGVLTYNTRNFTVGQLGDAGTLAYTNAADYISHLAVLWFNVYSNAAFANILARSNSLITDSIARSNSLITDSIARSNANWLDVRSDPLGAGRLAGTNTWTGTNNFERMGVVSNAHLFTVQATDVTLTNVSISGTFSIGSVLGSIGFNGGSGSQITDNDNNLPLISFEYDSVDATDFNGTTFDGTTFTGTSGNFAAVNTSTLIVSNGAAITGAITNITASGQTILPVESDISFGRKAITTLANGNNDDLAVGTNVFIQVSGPTAAFAIRGIANPRDGKMVVILNKTTYDMTIACEGGASGNQATAENRIITMTGADRATTGNGSATLIYSASESRWQLISLDP